jgi:hypothetical protein
MKAMHEQYEQFQLRLFQEKKIQEAIRICRISSAPDSWFSPLPITYIHTFIYSYIHTYIHSFLCALKHTKVHTYIHTYIYTYIFIHIHTYIHAATHFAMWWWSWRPLWTSCPLPTISTRTTSASPGARPSLVRYAALRILTNSIIHTYVHTYIHSFYAFTG